MQEDNESYTESESSLCWHLKDEEDHREHYVDDLYMVSVPLDHAESARVTSPRLKLKFGSLASPKRKAKKRPKKNSRFARLANSKMRSILPEPHNAYPGLHVKLLDSALNPTSVIFFCLAIGVALYSHLLENCMKSMVEPLPSTRANDARLTVMALKDHTVRSVNSTIWNLERTANFSLNAVIQASNLSDEDPSAVNLLSENTSKVRALDINRQQFIGKRSVKESIQDRTAVAIRNMSQALNESRSQLLLINDFVVPAANSSSTSDGNSNSLHNVSSIRRTAQIWIVIFALMGIASLIPVAFLNVWNWRRQGDYEHTKDRYDFREVNFKSNNAIVSGTSRLLSQKINAWRGRDANSLFQARLEWCFNFCFTGCMMKFLTVSVVLAILSIACSTIYNQANGFLKSSLTHSDTASPGNFQQFEKRLNDNCYNLLATLLANLGTAYENCASVLSGELSVRFQEISPFNSVAFEHMSFSSDFLSSARTPDVKDFVWNYLHSLTKIFWIVSLVLFTSWIICGMIVCGYTLRQICLRESVLYGRRLHRKE